MNPSLSRLLATLLFVESDESEEYLDLKYDTTDFLPASRDALWRRFQAFISKAEEQITAKMGSSWTSIDDFYTGGGSGGLHVEHDYIMTVNRTGCGFWEKGDWAEPVGDILDALAKQETEIHVHVNDHGKLEIDC
jgi:hypothetical protein